MQIKDLRPDLFKYLIDMSTDSSGLTDEQLQLEARLIILAGRYVLSPLLSLY
jgi:hypothetical protein